MSKISVLDKKGNETATIDMPEGIFSGKVKKQLLHQAVVKYLASLRQGNASTKERADVSGGGKKPYRQKGTGRARAGSSRSPLWKGGGVTFGPHPRDFSYTIPKKIKKAALKEALNTKFQSEQIFCIDDLTENLTKTKEFAALMKTLNITGKTLALLDGSHDSAVLVSRNIPNLLNMRSADVNAYDILRSKNLLLTKTALNNLLERIQK
ncbi:MAG: 50S ribosomal protein L4 [Candidatus Omnitrophica bacterium]|nr:50S ribosomal protein L4 [Candidatus Omnitrophota bacterium]